MGNMANNPMTSFRLLIMLFKGPRTIILIKPLNLLQIQDGDKMLPIFGSSIVYGTHTTNTHRELIKWACSPLEAIIWNLKLTMDNAYDPITPYPCPDSTNIPSPLVNPLWSMGPAHAQLGFNSIREVFSTCSQLSNLVSKVGKPCDKDNALYSLTKQLW